MTRAATACRLTRWSDGTLRLTTTPWRRRRKALPPSRTLSTCTPRGRQVHFWHAMILGITTIPHGTSDVWVVVMPRYEEGHDRSGKGERAHAACCAAGGRCGGCGAQTPQVIVPRAATPSLLYTLNFIVQLSRPPPTSGARGQLRSALRPASHMSHSFWLPALSCHLRLGVCITN